MVFRKRNPVKHNLFTLFMNLLNKGGEVDALFLEFSKAFDKVPHVRLLKKLEHYGICPQLIQWIKDFLEHRQQQVVLDGITIVSRVKFFLVSHRVQSYRPFYYLSVLLITYHLL